MEWMLEVCRITFFFSLMAIKNKDPARTSMVEGNAANYNFPIENTGLAEVQI